MNAARVILPGVLAASLYAQCLNAEEIKVQITPDIASVDVMHEGRLVTIMRNQDIQNTVKDSYAKTSRKCPPFCINPIQIAPGVETLGEVELLDYLQRVSNGDKSVMVIDSRTPAWVQRGTIPGSVNIPYTELSESKGATEDSIASILTGKFNARKTAGGYNFSNAKTLVLFCNGMWCGQSPANIRLLLKMGYPPEKIKWYRGGMQNWENLGLTTIY